MSVGRERALGEAKDGAMEARHLIEDTVDEKGEIKFKRLKRRAFLSHLRNILRVMAVIAVPMLIRFGLLIGMGVDQVDLQSAFFDFPPPATIHGTGPFPLMLKFHKVAGSTMIETLWRNVQCDTPGGLAEAWRKPLCGEYDRHKNLMFVRGGLPTCARTSQHLVVALFRHPVNKLISTLYWYPPHRLRSGAPWTTHIGNWTERDVVYMLSMLSADRNPSLQPPLQEYTAVLGGGTAHSAIAERQQVQAAAEAAAHPQSGRGDLKAHGRLGRVHRSHPGAPYDQGRARRAAVLRVRSDAKLVVGLAERMDASMVLVALKLGWPVESMVYRSSKATAHLKPGDKHYNPNAGKYGLLSPRVRAFVVEQLQRDDLAVYGAAVARHERQAGELTGFPQQLTDFKALLAASKGQGGPQCVPLRTRGMTRGGKGPG